MSTQTGKEVLYIDVDDEITTIIDKVRGAHEKIVALVLPKRATVLQSIVNMKLLKRTADESKKHLVLITGEAGLSPLAGSVGLYVAKTLQSRPEVPSAPVAEQEGADDAEEAVSMADDDLDSSKPVGEHLRRAPASVVKPDAMTGDDDSPIELDNTTPIPAAKVAKPKKGKKFGAAGKKFNIPDFDKFRLWAIVGGIAIVVFIFLWYMAFVAMPRASISIKTDSTAIQENLDLTLDSELDEANVSDAEVPAVIQQVQKTASQQVDATGQKDNGTKATGQATLSLKDCSDDTVTIPAGTGLSANGLTFVTQQPATMQSIKVGNQCRNSDFPNFSTKTVNIIAQNNGDKYNISSATFSVAGFSNVAGSGSAAGGTSNIVKIVAQADIDNAKQKIDEQNADAIKQELQRGLTAKGLFAIDVTFQSTDPEVTPSAKVGDEAATVSVTQKATYTMMGAKQADLKKIVADAVSDKIDQKRQQILDHGISSAVFKLQNQQNTTSLITMSVTAVAGSDLNVTDIQKQVAGKKTGDAKSIIGKYPGVTSVTVDYSPFWVSSIPKKASKITVTVEKPVVKNAD